jgi:putative ABC transport system permease protein
MSPAFRSFAKSPGFTVVVLLTLALGIGACTAIFSVVDALLFRSLPFPHADRLTVIWETNVAQAVKREGPSGPNFYDWREQSRSFQDMAAVELGSGTVTGLGEPRQIPAMRVTANFFDVLDVRPELGRLFAAAEGRGRARQALVVISHDFWQRALGGDPHVVGKTVMVDLIPYQVIGVLAPDFSLPFQSELYVPWPDDELRFGRGRLAHDLGVIGRLKPDVSVTQAEDELNAIAARLRAAHPSLAGWSVSVVPLQTVASEYIRPALVALFCAVGFVLLIACTNVANLLLARAVDRRREMALRAALGASRWRLVRQCLIENVVLGLAAGAIGLLLATWGVSLLSAMVPHTVPIPDAAAEVRLRAFDIDGRALVFSLVVSLLTSGLFGLAPALQAFKADLIDSLKNSRTGAGGGRRLREILLVAEVAIAFVLLAGAGLTLQSFRQLQHTDLGFRADHLLTLEMELPTDSNYRTPREQSAFFSRVLEQTASLPGVASVAVTSVLPLHSQDQRATFLIENAPALPANEQFQTDARRVSAGYFKTMGIPLERGRLLDDRDRDDKNAPLVGVVDATFARRFFGEQNPVGRYLLLGKTRVEIVGIVGSVKHAGADREVRPTLYVSFLQRPAERMNLVLRTSAGTEQGRSGDPDSLVATVKNAIWSIDRDQPIYRIESMESVVAKATSAPRLTLSLLSVFAVVALVLAAIGIYGVMTYSVAQRTNEIGIRMALGARSAHVLAQVLRQGMTVVALGLAIGLASLLALSQLAQSLLYETSPHDPFVLTAIPALLAAVALLACWLPARRATRVDPTVALRAE